MEQGCVTPPSFGFPSTTLQSFAAPNAAAHVYADSSSQAVFGVLSGWEGPLRSMARRRVL